MKHSGQPRSAHLYAMHALEEASRQGSCEGGMRECKATGEQVRDTRQGYRVHDGGIYRWAHSRPAHAFTCTQISCMSAWGSMS